MTLIRALAREEYELLRDFTFLAIHVPEGEPLPPMSVVDDEVMLRQYWGGFGSQPGDVAMAAEIEGAVVGTAWSRLLTDPRGYGNVDDETPELAIAVRPEHRGQGIGARLLTALLAALAEAGWPSLSLSVDKQNQAINLYRRAGFEPVSENQDDYLMVASTAAMRPA